MKAAREVLREEIGLELSLKEWIGYEGRKEGRRKHGRRGISSKVFLIAPHMLFSHQCLFLLSI